jgi:type I restriction enzyme, S subunit
VDELMGLCDRLQSAQQNRESQRDRLVAASLHHLNQSADGEFGDRARFYFNHLSELTVRSEHIRELRQTILNLAVRGKLVPQDPSDEKASELYDRLASYIDDFNQENKIRRRKEIMTSNDESFLKLFPISWIVTNFDSVNNIASGVAKGKNLRGLETLTYPYLRVANVQRGFLDLSLIKEIEIRIDEFDRYRLQSGDVLMTEGGDWDKLGRAAIWNEEIPDCIHQNHIYRIRSANKNELLPRWITLFANSYLGRSYFEGASKQTTNLASINMTQLRSCPLPIPPTKEQYRIVAKVDELMAQCDRLETQLTTTQTTSRQLLESLLHKALNPSV